MRFEAAVEQATAGVYARWEAVDVLVNNAGSELNKTYNETTVEEWDKVLDTDLKGPWLLCKHFVPPMVEHGSGSVINISSLNGLVGFPLSTAYGSAKGGARRVHAGYGHRIGDYRRANQLCLPGCDRDTDDGAVDRPDAR